LTSTTIRWTMKKLTAQQRKKRIGSVATTGQPVASARGLLRLCRLAVVPGNAHEDPVLYELVENFVRHVAGRDPAAHPGPRFIDGPTHPLPKRVGIDVLLPVKKNMDIWADAGIVKQSSLEPWSPPAARPSAPPNVPRRLSAGNSNGKRPWRPSAKNHRRPRRDTHAHRTLSGQGCTSWTECKVPMNVLLLREQYADGHQDQWALMTTADFADPAGPRNNTTCGPPLRNATALEMLLRLERLPLRSLNSSPRKSCLFY